MALKKLPLLCLPLVLACCIRQPTSQDPEEKSVTPACTSALLLDVRLFDSLVIADSMTALVEFFSPTCPACQSLTCMVDSLAAVYKDSVLVGRINADTDTVLWKRYAVLSWPTFLFFKDGSLLPQRYNTTSYDTLARVLDSLLLNP